VTLNETLLLDALILLVSIIFIYLTYNASVRLAKRKDVSGTWFVILRLVTLGECVGLLYTMVDIPWTVIMMLFPQFAAFNILKFLIIYGIVSTIIVAPAIAQILRVPFAEKDREKDVILEERDDLLQEMKIVTSRFLRKEISERVFLEVSRELEEKIVSLDAKIEKIKFAEGSSRSARAKERYRELFKP
jgi:hypothetical protein